MLQDFNNYKTPQEKLEDLLKEIEADLNANKQDIACEQLSKIGKQYEDLLQGVSTLYEQYLTLQRRC